MVEWIHRFRAFKEKFLLLVCGRRKNLFSEPISFSQFLVGLVVSFVAYVVLIYCLTP